MEDGLMSTVKTAVSLDKSLFAQVEAIAQEMQVSRSRLVALALEEFVGRRENRRLIEQINAVVDGATETAEDRALLNDMRRRHRKIVEGDWS